MPFVNVIKGEQLPTSAFTVRTPILRIPWWAIIGWQIAKTLGQLAVAYVRFWYATVPATMLGWLYLRYGWVGPVALVGSITAAGAVWWFGHRSSCLRFGWWPILARFRRFLYRRRWHAAMVTAKLAVSFDQHTVIPILKRVRCRTGTDIVLVRMVTGQIPDDFATVSERLAHTFGVRQVKATPGPTYGTVVLTLLRGDPLTKLIAALPVTAVPDFTALPIAVQEDRQIYGLRLFGTQVLIVGATGSGKGSVIWAIVRSLAGGVG